MMRCAAITRLDGNTDVHVRSCNIWLGEVFVKMQSLFDAAIVMKSLIPKKKKEIE
jgi:hypothetical protein